MRKNFITITILISLFLNPACKKETQNYIIASGVLDTTQIRIASKLGGRIIKMYAQEGSNVKKGDILFETDCQELKLQLLQSEINYKILDNQYKLTVKGARKEDIEQLRYSTEILKTNLAVAKNDYERAKRLFEANAISQKQLEDIELKVKVIERQIDASEENLKKVKNISRAEEIEMARLRLESSKIASDILKERLSECIVASPINGIVLRKNFNEMEFTQIGVPVYIVSDNSVINLKIYLPEPDVFKIKRGDIAKVRVDGISREFEGKVIFISDEAEFTPKNIQTKDERVKLVFMVKLEIDNSEGILKSGLPADTYFFKGK